MEEQWIGHLIETEEGAVSCLINIALAADCPQPDRPVCTVVRVAFSDPGEGGFGSEAEREHFSGFEDQLEVRMGKKGVHFASVRGRGVLDIWYYSSQVGADELGAIARVVCKGSEIEVTSNHDPEWEMFQGLFPSPEAIGQYHDMQLISVLQEQGDQIESPRPVDHMIYLPGSAAADDAAKLAAKMGFKETDRYELPEEELSIGLQLTKEHSVDPDSITNERAYLTNLAVGLGGTYDGWQTPLVK